MSDHLIILLLGPSGTGKSSEEKRLEETGKFLRTISHTSRKRRDHEQEGREYFFISREELLAMNDRGDLVEYVEYPPNLPFEQRNLYGSSRAEIDSKLQQGDILIVAEGHGCEQFIRAYPDQSIVVYFRPPVNAHGLPEVQVLAERLRWRGEKEEIIAQRLSSEHISEEMAYGDRLANLIVDAGRSLEYVHNDTLYGIEFLRTQSSQWRQQHRLDMVKRISTLRREQSA